MSNLKFFTILFSLVLIPLNIYAAAPTYNAGFVSGLWYSKTPFFAGDNIRIYAGFQNNSGGDITGVVRFFNNDIPIGESNFSAISNRLVETWIDWTVSYGSNTISAKIINAKRSEAGNPPEAIIVLEADAKPETIFVNNAPPPEPPPPLPPPVEPPPSVESQPIPASPAENFVNQSPSSVANALSTVGDYTNNSLQTVSTAREEVALKIKDIDEMYKKIDTDHDGSIGLADFNILMVNWNKKGENITDFNQDKIVDLIDFNILMIYWA